MGFEISMKKAGAYDKNTILNQGYTKPAYDSSNVRNAGEIRRPAVQPTAPVSRPAVQSSAPVSRPTPVQPSAPASRPTPVQSSAPASRPAPAPVIPPLPDSSTLLRRGQKFTVADKNGSVPSALKLKLDWNVANPQCDLDASAFLLAENEKVPGEDWFVFYGQPVSPDNSIRYSGNTGTGAEMLINLNQIRPDIQKIAFAVTIYEAIQQRLHFGMVQNVSARIFNQMNATELARIELTDCTAGVTALVVGELYRYKGAWKFNAVGSGVARDLAGFCAMYGIEAE
ncbi:MAG: hypothetical protein E7496_06990 [Ruminococcus sp.]|nr:hypothetical protein [Ruminococcus sp.]